MAEEAPKEVLFGLDIGFLDFLLQLDKDNNETMSMEMNDKIAEKVFATGVHTAKELAEEIYAIIIVVNRGLSHLNLQMTF